MSLREYTEWMKGLLTFMPDGRLRGEVIRNGRAAAQNVCAYGVFSAHAHRARVGPLPPTGRSTTTDYVYVMQFTGGKISHMTKILECALGDEGTRLGLTLPRPINF